ncbi:unnamed protein product [Victoria cruziana]
MDFVESFSPESSAMVLEAETVNLDMRIKCESSGEKKVENGENCYLQLTSHAANAGSTLASDGNSSKLHI